MAERVDLPTPGQVLNLSIEQAVMGVLQHNRDLKIQKLEPVKVGTFENIERAAFDPELFAEILSTREELPASFRTDEGPIINDKTEFSGLGLRKKFATGTEVETGISHERSRPGDATDEQTTRIGLSLTQSLLKGFGPSVNLVDVKQARLDTALSVQELKGFTETLVAETEMAYWQYVLAGRKIAIFEQSLEIAKTQRDEIEEQISVGLLPRTEAAAARSEVALQEQALINAKSTLEEQRLKLLHHISPGGEDPFDLQVNPTSIPEIETLPITNLPDRIRLAEETRSELNEAQLRLEKNRLETIMTQNGMLPRLDLFMALGRSGYGDRFSTAFKGMGDHSLNDFQIGLSLNHPMGNRAPEAKDMAAVTSRLQARIAVENLIKLIELDVRLAVNEVERTKKQIAASRTTRQFQEQTSRAEKERFDVGSSTALLVTQAQHDLLIARIAEVEATVNFRMALVKLYLAEGSLLEMRGIGIEGNYAIE